MRQPLMALLQLTLTTVAASLPWDGAHRSPNDLAAIVVPAATTRCTISTSTGDLGIRAGTMVVRPGGVVCGVGLGLM
jgi:hypothetical protein